MKNIFTLKNSFIAVALLLGLLISGLLIKKDNTKLKAIKKFESFLVGEYRKVPHFDPGKNNEMAADQPEMAALQDYFMTLDPATGTIPRERLAKAYRQTLDLQSLKSGETTIQWQGYASDMGGRTRTIMYDPNDPLHKKVWAGGVTGGLWYNNNIEDEFSSWIPVNDFWPCLSIRCITFDPNNPMIFYIGTGEAETARQTYRESSGVGDGIWKSMDGGQTWNQLLSTTQFAYVSDIAIRNEAGSSVIYAGVASGLYHGTQHQSQPSDGLFRSVDGGNAWEQVLPDISGTTVPYAVSEIVLSSDATRIFVGTRPNLNGEGGATILYSDLGTVNSWVSNEYWKIEIENEPLYNIPGRVVLATAPSDPNVVYALFASGFVNPDRSNFEDYYCRYMIQSVDKGENWTRVDPPHLWNIYGADTNFATLAWHALDIAIDPNNENTIYIGGLDVYRTTDACVNWSHLSDWSLMYWGGGTQYIHGDQHVILYKPGSSNEILFGSDGGVFYTSNGNAAQPNFEERNHNFNTLQFYTCAIKPTAGSNNFLGGLQDNGSLRYTGTPLSINDMVSGGDGAYAFYDKNEPSISISTVYYNSFYIFNYDNFIKYIGDWYPSGVFINPMDYDYRTNTIYANACSFTGINADNLLKIGGITGSYSGTFLPLNTGTQVYFSAVKYSQYSPNGKTTLFLGTQAGQLFKILDAESNPAATEITGSSFPTANISSISIGGSEDTLLVTFSNYGIISVWQTYNGGQTWQSKEGNLPDMPIRWAIYHPQDHHYAMLATETGVWTTSNIDNTDPVWEPVNDGMANVRVDMLDMRESDNTVLAATHGRGFFTTTWDVVTGLNNIQHSAIRCFPNPTNGQINVAGSSQGTEPIEVKIYDLGGTLLFQGQESALSGTFSEKIDISNRTAGIYFLKVTEGGKTIKTEKIIKY